MIILSEIISFGALGVLLGSLAINLIPFLSPSNLILAAFFSFILSDYNPAWIAILVAVGASTAKLIHYQLSYLMGTLLSSKINGRISPEIQKFIREWGSLGAFIAAISPIPDDPIVLPMGLLRFNLVKFFLAYFIGKVAVCLIGAYMALQISYVKIFDPFIAAISILAYILIIGFITHTEIFKKKYPNILLFMIKLKHRLKRPF